jgi:hypothetical protein
MEKVPFSTPNSTLKQETFTVSQSHNTLLVHLQGHSWVSVSQGDREIVRDGSTNPNYRFSVAPGTYVISSDGTIENVSSEFIEPTPSFLEQLQQSFLLRLTSDAPDQHIVDGIGEIPADGTSFCTIAIQKVTFDGKLLTGAENQDELFLRTTGGVLLDAEGQSRIRSLNLKLGQASFRLASEASPKLITVSVFGRSPLPSKAEIQIEFV